jgi:hypothetical protein
MSFLFRGYFLLFLYYLNRHQLELHTTKKSSWFVRNRVYASTKFNLGIYIGHALFWLAIGLAVQFGYPAPNDFLTSDDCFATVFPVIAAQAGLAILLLAVLVVLLWGVRDNYGLKLEMVVTLATMFPLAVVWGLRSTFSSIFPPSFYATQIVVVIVVISNSISIWFPAFYSFKPTKSRDSFSTKMLLRDQEFLDELQEFAKTIFCVEVVLCFRDLSAYKENYPDLVDRADHIVDQFIRVGAPLEVNLTAAARNMAMENTIARFDLALEETERLIMQDILPKMTATEGYKQLRRAASSRSPDITVHA